jgi:FlaA1/EpsC-like NDP-sugar epimerase
VSEAALTSEARWRLARGLGRQRWLRITAQVGYDGACWLCALLVAARATHGLAGTHLTGTAFWYEVPGTCVLVAVSGLAAGLYRGRYLRGSSDEVMAVMLAAALTAGCLVVVAPLLPAGQRALLETVALGALLALAAMLGSRYVDYAARLRARPSAGTAVKVIVFGAGDAGALLIRRLATKSGAAYRPVAILDDDLAKRRLRIHGVPVLGGRGQMAEVAASTGATVLVIAIAGEAAQVIQDLTEAAERCGLAAKVIPSLRELLTGRAQIEGVRDPRIGDLLGRRAVTAEVASVREHIAGQRVLVTGAGGSIGAELCRQLHRLGPAQLIMLDRDESALHAIQLTLYGRALLDSEETVLADIRDQHRVREVFARFRPDIVFHAAALKHLPLLECCPAEALKSNVLGTLAVLEAAADYGVRSFVNISTDKAANPVSVLGYSKRITERLTASMSARAGGRYLSVRFGNVLGSRGSVLITLSAQVAAGGPVTVTDPEVSRYFMLADEAVHLVLQAAAIGRAGEVLVLDMGEPVRIADMARRLAASGGREVRIVFTGLRPGEKLIEDRLARGETDQRPNHPLISQVPVPPLSADEVTGLDPHADADSLRRALAQLARGSSGGGIKTIPPQSSRDALAAGEDRQADGEPAGRSRPQAASHLQMRTGPRPAELGQPGRRPIQQVGHVRVGAERPAGRVWYVVIGRVAQQRRALPSGVDTRQPARERLTRRPGPDPVAPPDELPERERTRPRPGLGHHGIPEVVPGHRQHQAGASQVGGAGNAASVRGDVDPVPGHDRDDLRVRWISAAQHPGRAHSRRHAELRQPPGEKRGRHHRPAYVRGAQHDDADRIVIVLPRARGRNARYAANISHDDIAGYFSSFAFGECSPRILACMRIDFIAPALDVHSFYAVRAGKRRAVGSIRFRTAPVTCQSERKSR